MSSETEMTAQGNGAQATAPSAIFELLGKQEHELPEEIRNNLANFTFGVVPPRLDFNILSYFVALVCSIPAVVIGFLGLIDEDEETSIDLEGGKIYGRVLVPGVLWLIMGYALTAMLRLLFGQDLIQEKASDVDVRETMRSNLTNTGVVGALFLTVVLAMMQADSPEEDTSRLICQWYQIFLLTGLFAFFLATMMASLLLMYIEPLDSVSGLLFVQNNLDYFGEPVPALLFGIVNVGYAAVVWVFGVYGRACGIICALAVFFCLQRVTLTFLYLSAWENPLVSKQTRKNNLNLATELGQSQTEQWNDSCCTRFAAAFQPSQE